METYIDLKKLNLDELVGVINLYPWFGAARTELCARMSRMGEGWSDAQFADAAMYVASRDKLAAIWRKARKGDWQDADVEDILKSYIEDKAVEPEAQETSYVSERKVFVVGGDYFSQEAYDKVRRSDDNVFSRYAVKAKSERPAEGADSPISFDIYTETLAQIYAEQGYFEQAKEIYSKLILAYPEKNAYFAALIQKLDELN